MPHCTPHEPVRSITIGNRTTVALHGEFDIAVAPLLTAHLHAATAGHRPDVVVDLRAVTFIDCSTLALLFTAMRRCQQRRGHLTVTCTDPRTLRLLYLTGLLLSFTLTDST